MIGHYKGTHHISTTHSLFSIMIHIHPRLRDKILNHISKKICKRWMTTRTSLE